MRHGSATVQLLAFASSDPEFVGQKEEVVAFSVAVPERTLSKQTGQWEMATSFFDVTAFGPTAQAVKRYVAKGRQILILGRLIQRRWQTQEGHSRAAVRIIAERVIFLPAPRPRKDINEVLEEDVEFPDDQDIPF